MTAREVSSEDWLSVKQVMIRCDVSRRTVENWFASGLERFWLGRRVYTTVQAITRFAKLDIPEQLRSRGSESDRILDAIGV